MTTFIPSVTDLLIQETAAPRAKVSPDRGDEGPSSASQTWLQTRTPWDLAKGQTLIRISYKIPGGAGAPGPRPTV